MMKIRMVLIGLLIIASAGMKVKATGNVAKTEALYIYNFLRHINWPEASGGNSFVIGVYGDSQVYDQLKTFVKNRKVGSKPILVRRVSSINDAATCQLLFVSNSHSSKIASLKNRLGNRPCLVVGEKEGSLASGSTIEFLIRDNKLKFRINEERAKQQNLALSKSLLDMGK